MFEKIELLHTFYKSDCQQMVLSNRRDICFLSAIFKVNEAVYFLIAQYANVALKITTWRLQCSRFVTNRNWCYQQVCVHLSVNIPSLLMHI